ncbi:MAG TPA: protein phosphatase 2C domain-containing protein [Acidimicrobiales bacterium]|nr:protein phosphatase 2C domain-containing protein [Acidimicrobiales bacterium]
MTDAGLTEPVVTEPPPEAAVAQPVAPEPVAPELAVPEQAVTPEAAAGCPACGEPIVTGARYCEACGNELPFTEAAVVTPVPEAPPAPLAVAVTCPSCGNQGEPVEGYCGICGMRLPAARDHQEQELELVAGVSDKGIRHHRNEDAMAMFIGDGFVVALVCDGVSTTVNPDVASQAAADAACAVLAERPDHDAAYDAARAAVLATAYEPAADLGPPSCTYLAAMVTDQRITFASLGDCRSYWVTPGSATQITVDDSWAELQIASGAMSRAEAYAHPNAHVITRWLANDADPTWRPTRVDFDVPGPGRLLLVSDGLWNYTIEPATLVAATGDEPLGRLDLARRLVTFANEAGGSDNITVVVVDLPLKDADLKGSSAP